MTITIKVTTKTVNELNKKAGEPAFTESYPLWVLVQHNIINSNSFISKIQTS